MRNPVYPCLIFILIVEDESAIADTLIYALQAEGFTTGWFPLTAVMVVITRKLDWYSIGKVEPQFG